MKITAEQKLENTKLDIIQASQLPVLTETMYMILKQLEMINETLSEAFLGYNGFSHYSRVDGKDL